MEIVLSERYHLVPLQLLVTRPVTTAASGYGASVPAASGYGASVPAASGYGATVLTAGYGVAKPIQKIVELILPNSPGMRFFSAMSRDDPEEFFKALKDLPGVEQYRHSLYDAAKLGHLNTFKALL